MTRFAFILCLALAAALPVRPPDVPVADTLATAIKGQSVPALDILVIREGVVVDQAAPAPGAP